MPKLIDRFFNWLSKGRTRVNELGLTEDEHAVYVQHLMNGNRSAARSMLLKNKK
jgi:hypothetical protein